MASKRDKDKSVEELIREAEALLESDKPKKKKKEIEFQFHRDSKTGKRPRNYEYRPRFQSRPDQHSEACSSMEEPPIDDIHVDQLDDEQDVEFRREEEEQELTDKDQYLEELLHKCQAVLDSFQPVEEVKWEKRMETLNENWEASRPLIFKTILFSQCPGIPQECEVCHEEPWFVRCEECSGKKMCHRCDATTHEKLLFHDREALVDDSFQHIPPNVLVNDNGKVEECRKHLFYHDLSDMCPQCQQRNTLSLCPLAGSIIVVNQKGRFDFNDYTVVCSCCGYYINPWSLERIIAAGYWPGSPKDFNYLFDQNLFRQWDLLQKRLPGSSEVSFLKALGDFSQSKGRSPTITANTFNRSFKEWKFCTYEMQIAQGLSWMECPVCAVEQHSCHVDGNMKLYRYQASGKQRRPCYYGSAFIALKSEVDCHVKEVYANAPRSKNMKDSMCGESHWKAAHNTARRRGKLDETGLEIAGCRHGLAQWAVNMYQGEIYGYAHFIQSKKMLPAGVNFFWEDIVCKYWKWAAKVGGSETRVMKPALSVMHAKAHKWSCQVLWGGRWQKGSACTTGEEVEQINAHMSRCGNTTKYMLPEGMQMFDGCNQAFIPQLHERRDY